MSKQANPKMIGSFVMGAMLLVMAGLIAFGNGKFFTDKLTFIMYFDGDIGGLEIGSPVEFKGVKVGSVSDIKIVMDREHGYSLHMPVTVELEPDRITLIGATKDDSARSATTEFTDEVVIKSMVFRGLRGQIGLQSLVTGKLKIVLAMHPDTPVNRRDYASRPEIPTVRSPVEVFMEKLQNLKIEEVMASVIRAADGIEKLVSSRELQNSIASLNLTLEDFSTLADNLNQKLDPLLGEFTSALKNFQRLSRNVDHNFEEASTDFRQTMKAAMESLDNANGAIANANGTIANMDGAIKNASPLQYELERTLKELSSAARSIRIMAEYLERHPESLLSGKGNSGR